jgi:indole-3-glycerol phosphate synthase
MIGILDKIVRHKKQEIQKLNAVEPLSRLVIDYRLKNTSISMQEAIINGSGVIAEFKRASPSKGLINAEADIISVTHGYQNSGASAISVLTDSHFFGAVEGDLSSARETVDIPILRKDFTIDLYQIYQAKIMGADCILLIAAMLTADEIKEFIRVANDLGMDSIIEVHNQTELDKLSGNEKIIGVNNRNLDTFEVDIETSLQLVNQLGDVIKVSESGLDADSNIKALVNAGYHGFLVGESFMKDDDASQACQNFVDKVNLLKS